MEEQLIAAVFKRRAIWDPTDELRRNSRILRMLWTEVAMELGIDVTTAKNKWKNLRAYFIHQNRELDKQRSENGGSLKSKSSWSFYEQLSFLNDAVTPKNNARDDSSTPADGVESSYPAAEGLNEGSPIASAGEDSTEENDEDTTPVLKDESCWNNDEGFTREKKDFRSMRGMTSKHKLNGGKDRFNGSGEEEFKEIDRRRRELLAARNLRSEEHPDLMFFKSLLPYMAELAPIKRLRLRSKIQDLILAECEASQ